MKISTKINALNILITYYTNQINNQNNTEEIILKAREKRREVIIEIDSLLNRMKDDLARDVYSNAFDKYQENIFENISKSEQTHMDKILVLLNKFNMEDSASPIEGEFNNQELSNLYSDLISKVDLSLND